MDSTKRDYYCTVTGVDPRKKKTRANSGIIEQKNGVG